jgi:hypothetical protein
MEELTGKTVMIHPSLDHDPMNKQGELGTISHILLELDEIYVQFPNGQLGLYSSDALLMLIPGPFIIDKLRGENQDLQSADLLAILEIYLLQSTGEIKYQQEAMRIALGDAQLFFATIVCLKDWIDLGLENKRDIESHPKMTR